MWHGHVAKRLPQEQNVEVSLHFLPSNSYINYYYYYLLLAKGHTNVLTCDALICRLYCSTGMKMGEK
jgi:hypothetical protein